MKSIRFSETVNYYLEASTRLNKPAAPESFCCLGRERDSNIYGVIPIYFSWSSPLYMYCWYWFQHCSNFCDTLNIWMRVFPAMFWNVSIVKSKTNMFARFRSISPRFHSFALIGLSPDLHASTEGNIFCAQVECFVWIQHFFFGPAQILYFGSFHKRMQKTSTAFANVKNPYLIWTTCFCLIKYTHEFDPTKLFFWRNLETINTCQR